MDFDHYSLDGSWIACPICYGEGDLADGTVCQFCAGTGTVQEVLWDEEEKGAKRLFISTCENPDCVAEKHEWVEEVPEPEVCPFCGNMCYGGFYDGSGDNTPPGTERY